MLFIIVDQKGVGFSLLRVGVKRRRTKQEILDDKEEARVKEEAIQGKLAEFAAMKAKADDYDRMAESVRNAEQMRDSLLESGHIVRDDEGNLSPVKLE